MLTMIIKTLFELAAIIALGYGYMHEKEIIAFEEKYFPVWKGYLKKLFTSFRIRLASTLK